MSKTIFKLNRKGVADIMKSDGMQKILKDKASEIKNRCGDGFEQDIHVGKNRANAMVYAETIQAKKENLDNNTILKAVR